MSSHESEAKLRSVCRLLARGPRDEWFDESHAAKSSVRHSCRIPAESACLLVEIMPKSKITANLHPFTTRTAYFGHIPSGKMQIRSNIRISTHSRPISLQIRRNFGTNHSSHADPKRSLAVYLPIISQQLTLFQYLRSQKRLAYQHPLMKHLHIHLRKLPTNLQHIRDDFHRCV